MGKAMAGVLIVLIIAVAVLLLVRSMNRTAERKKNLSNALLELTHYKNTVREIEAELDMQTLAGYFDPAPFHAILSDHKKDATTT